MTNLLGHISLFFKLWRPDGNIQPGFHHSLGLLNYRNSCTNSWFVMHDSSESRSVLSSLKVYLTTQAWWWEMERWARWQSMGSLPSNSALVLSLQLLSFVGESHGNSKGTVCNCKHTETFFWGKSHLKMYPQKIDFLSLNEGLIL